MAGDYFSKLWGITYSYTNALLALLFFIPTTVVWLMILTKDNSVAKISVLLAVSSAMTALFCGTVIFGETITTKQIIGIIIGIVAVYFLS